MSCFLQSHKHRERFLYRSHNIFIFVCDTTKFGELQHYPMNYLQWNPDFSNTRLFETPDSSNQKSFPLNLLQSNTVILPPIFRMLDFSKLPIFRTNSFFLWKIYIRFLELCKLRNQQKPVLATYRPKCNLKQVPEKVFSCIFYYKASDKSVIEVILKKLQGRCYTIEGPWITVHDQSSFV